ncbi:HNH endonuclease [Pseudarthrobacter sp. NPDC080039]|uniref:HNH endonuclease signature motif containing protein n=1 Tax=unclassified Pseudarthrobacter TaxID=2647000 RepID=UPI00344E6490
MAASLLLGAGTATEFSKVPTPRADVLVTVPVFSLLGLTDESAALEGFGPIPASMARKLVADGADSFYRVLVDPRDGAPLEIGRTRYRLTEAIKRWIRMRDRKCTFPGCTNRTPDNDTDHLTAWHRGGTTGTSNLAQLCPKHHRLKHHSRWTPDPATNHHPPGWTSPTGRYYKPEHPNPEPPQWPQWLTSTSNQCVDASPEDLPPWEPDDEALIDLDDLSPEDPVWADFFARPFVPLV